jgi:hypothetical protein
MEKSGDISINTVHGKLTIFTKESVNEILNERLKKVSSYNTYTNDNTDHSNWNTDSKNFKINPFQNKDLSEISEVSEEDEETRIFRLKCEEPIEEEKIEDKWISNKDGTFKEGNFEDQSRLKFRKF